MTQLFADAAKLTNKAKGQYGLGVDGTDIWNVAPYVWSQAAASRTRLRRRRPGT